MKQRNVKNENKNRFIANYFDMELNDINSNGENVVAGNQKLFQFLSYENC